ncbi:MAG TPA: CBS domain-containing protein [Acetobacteraceae bacterium]|nr:CBS domain-containing protein [Acetobacteraceae bacterium]
MRASDVMTPTVVTVDPDMTVQDLAKLLSESGVSGAPVMDSAGKLVGIVSEGDLLHRAELGTAHHTERRRSWWLRHFAAAEARDYAKSHGRLVKDVMTTNVATVEEETSLAEVATLLERRRIKRVPVLRDGRLVGIITRSNLVRALAAAKPSTPLMTDHDDDDRAIRLRLLADLNGQNWATRVWPQDILVNHGVVTLWFSSDEPEANRRAIRVVAENVPGVHDVQENIVPAPLLPTF